MTVFKTFLKVLNKNKFIVIMYTVILVSFASINFKNNDINSSFVADKPDILIINNDSNLGITKNLIQYLEDKCVIKDIVLEDTKINDALFYRDVNYIIYIPDDFRIDFLNKKNPQIEVKSTGDYNASLAEMILEKYLNIANVYNETLDNERLIIENINKTLDKEIEVKLTSNLDNEGLTNASRYYNFTSYSLLAGLVYVIAIILSSFKDEKILKRTNISSTSYKKINRYLLLSNSLFGLLLWFIYVVISFILVGNIMFSIRGIIYIINLFIFTIVALAISFLIGSVVKNKNAINGIVNVIALGSSFLCGAFVPMEWLPNSVLIVGHIFPTYYFIKSNEILVNLEKINLESLKPIILNMIILGIFAIIFIVITNIISKNKRKIS
ncbi:MAG: ABC transporter permease [Ruminococcus sp.]|nr:ABC transporter permease [Ruminococcus sp.]